MTDELAASDDTRRLSDEELAERAELLEDIRVADEQIARGEGIPHEVAREQVMARLRR